MTEPKLRELRATDLRYHRMSVVQKRTESPARMREPFVSCPACDMQVAPVDLLRHLAERCDGPREPGPGAKWVTWREALAMGVARSTLSHWATHGFVRFVGERQDRKYLLRDLAIKIAQRAGFRRR